MVDFLTNLISLEWLAIYWGIGLLFFAAEYCWPSRALLYRHVFLQDVGAFITYQVFFVVATQVTDRIPFPDYSHWRWQAVPFGFKLLVFLFVMDGIAYWMHRLWHTSWGWPRLKKRHDKAPE